MSWELRVDVYSKNETDNEVENSMFFFKLLNHIIEKSDIDDFASARS